MRAQWHYRAARSRLPVFVKLPVCRVGRESGIVSARSRRLFTPGDPDTRYTRVPDTPLPMPDIPEAVRDHLALALVPGLGPKLTAALLARFGSASAALRATAVELREIPHIGDKLATALAAALGKVDIGPELRLMEEHNVRAVPLGFPGYPPPLASVVAPPPLLYFRGEWMPSDAERDWHGRLASCTSYGLRIAAQIARDLARAGFTIVSGLARGIDAAAHRGCARRGRTNLAALAGGLSRIYPPEHAPLADEITAGTRLPHHRNANGDGTATGNVPGSQPHHQRLVAAVIVVEANAKSARSSRPATRPSRAARFLPSQVRSIASPVLAAMNFFAMAHGSSAARTM